MIKKSIPKYNYLCPTRPRIDWFLNWIYQKQNWNIDIVNKQLNLFEIVLFKQHKITCFLIKYSCAEQPCFPRMMIPVNTTFVSGTHLHISPNARSGNTCILYPNIIVHVTSIILIRDLSYMQKYWYISGFIIKKNRKKLHVCDCDNRYISLFLYDKSIPNG